MIRANKSHLSWLIPMCFGTGPSMISDEGRGKEHLEEQAQGGGDDQDNETDGLQ